MKKLKIVFIIIIFYFINIIGSLSRLLNTVLGGDPNETTCSRCGKYLKQSRKKSFIKFIPYCVYIVTNIFEKNHVFKYRQIYAGKYSLYNRIKEFINKK